MRTNETPNRMLRERGPRTPWKSPMRGVGSSSVARTSSFRPCAAMVARPAAHTLRTYWTFAQGDKIHRLREAPTTQTRLLRLLGMSSKATITAENASTATW
jgi:hypothetical protein